MFRLGGNTLLTAMLASSLYAGNSVAAEGAVIAAPASGVSAISTTSSPGISS